MRILFSMRHLGSFRMYEPVLRRLAADGHEIHIVANRRESLGWGAPATLLPDVARISWSWEDVRPTAWLELATAVRVWLDYLRYFEPMYASAPRLRARAAERVPEGLRRITEASWVRAAAGRRALAIVLRAIERSVPRQQASDALLRDHRPDMVLLTPLLHLGSPQIELLRSARALGVKTALCVGSWDHLSSKSLIRDVPDRIFVWNETQKREAVELHRVAADRVVVTGAQCYDQWFGRTPVRTREQFCSMVKLPSDRPFLLWVCSALFTGSPSEARFVRRWIEELRRSPDPVLRSAGVLVRPHPARLDEWREVDVSDLPDVAVYGGMPVDESSKEDYFDSLHFSAAVAGLNTSAFLEAAIVGRPVHTIVLPEFSDNQQGTLHFHYLTSVGGGLLQVAHTFDEHRRQLERSLREPQDGGRNARFVREFIRPAGIDRPATDVFGEAIDQFGRSPVPEPVRAPAWAPVLRLALYPLVVATHLLVARRAPAGDRTFHELKSARRKDEHRRGRETEEQRRKAERAAARQAAHQEEQRRRQARIDASEREKRERRSVKERARLQRDRAKRRTTMITQLKRRLGLASRQVR